MEKKITMGQIEAMIRKNIKDNGLMTDISEEKIAEIKGKIKNKLRLPGANFFALDFGVDGIEEDMNPGDDVKLPVQTVDTPAVIQSTVADEESIDNAKKEGELETREQYLARKEEELRKKEAELQQKESELKYQPQIPSFVEKAEPEQLFVFNTNELSYGPETLLRMPYHSVQNPEEKVTMEQLWLKKGKVRSEIFQVEFKKIGEMVFSPMNGICKFENITPEIPKDIPSEDRDSVAQAFLSQQPIEPMEDAVLPVTNVSLPMTNDMGLASVDVASVMQNVIEKALKNYLDNKGA